MPFQAPLAELWAEYARWGEGTASVICAGLTGFVNGLSQAKKALAVISIAFIAGGITVTALSGIIGAPGAIESLEEDTQYKLERLENRINDLSEDLRLLNRRTERLQEQHALVRCELEATRAGEDWRRCYVPN